MPIEATPESPFWSPMSPERLAAEERVQSQTPYEIIVNLLYFLGVAMAQNPYNRR